MRPVETDDSKMTRRAALGLLGAAATLPLVGAPARAGARNVEPASSRAILPPIYRGGRAPKPLPFDPKKLSGVSEKMIVSHHEKNYSGAVRRLDAIEAEIAALPQGAAPFRMGSLKREWLVAANSMRLHELYFANLGGGGVGDGAFADLASRQYGSLSAWEHDFRLTALSLSGGSGWVIATVDPTEGTLHNVWAADHTHAIPGGLPILVLDMYEHAYHMDYGADAKGYVEAFLANVAAGELDRRVDGAGRFEKKLRPGRTDSGRQP